MLITQAYATLGLSSLANALVPSPATHVFKAWLRAIRSNCDEVHKVHANVVQALLVDSSLLR